MEPAKKRDDWNITLAVPRTHLINAKLIVVLGTSPENVIAKHISCQVTYSRIAFDTELL